MPSYEVLFRDERGDDLVAYLQSLQGAGTAQHFEEEKQWQPSVAAFAQADLAEGEWLYEQTNGFGLGIGNVKKRSLRRQQLDRIRLETRRSLDESGQSFAIEAGDQNLFVAGNSHLRAFLSRIPFQTISQVLYH